MLHTHSQATYTSKDFYLTDGVTDDDDVDVDVDDDKDTMLAMVMLVLMTVLKC